MFKIGDFSKFTCVSIKQLRHYDELGLLKPKLVDPFTGYRYYSADQLPRLNRILALRDLGFSLEQIARLLDESVSLEQLRGMLKLRHAEIEQQMQREQSRLTRIESRLQQIADAEAPLLHYDVVLRSVETQVVAGIRQQVETNGNDVALLFDKVERFAANHQVRAPSPPLLLYHDGEYSVSQREVEVLVPLNRQLAGAPPITVRTLAGWASMACVIHTGGYDRLGHAFGALLRWIEANRYQISGPLRELYLRFGADQAGYRLPDVYLTNNDAEFVTELQLPIKREPTHAEQ
jgi:DNA-binding transcriptional MerR regulator